MANTYFVGMRDDTEFVTNEVPESWRKGYLELMPNGDASLTALTALMPSEKISGSIIHWWQKDLPTRRATFTAGQIFTNAACTAAYTSSGASGQTLYAKITTTQLGQFRVGHVVQLKDSDQPAMTVNAKITNIVAYDSTYSVVSLYLLEADDNGASITPTAKDLSDADVMVLIGNANPQGGTRPSSISVGPTEYYNRSQIFRTALDTTRTAEETELRTESHYQTVKKDAMQQHMLDMEMAFLFGKQGYITGANGKRETYTEGLVPFIRQYGVTSDFCQETGAAYAGQNWLTVGKEYMDAQLEEMFRYGSGERLVFCGSLALLGIQRLVDELGMYNLKEVGSSIGIKVLRWDTVFGMVNFKRHPLFTHEATLRNTMVAFEPKNLKYWYVTDTTFKRDLLYDQGAETDVDGRQESFITECGLEFGLPQTCMILDNVGNNNTQVAA